MNALKPFGLAAAGARETIRPLTTTTAAARVRAAAASALWAASGDPDEAIPVLLGLIDDPVTEAVDLLGEIGPPAAAALPRLRDHLTHAYEWVRVSCAAAIWEIGGQTEAPAVLKVLLEAVAHNPATANHVVACLDRMGTHATPALPLLREQLAGPRRGGRFRSIDHDEALQHACRTLIARLDPPAPGTPPPATV
jgi:hypothetical protein